MGNPAAVKVGPGLLYVAPVGTAAPTAGTADPEDGAWVPIGYTEEGHTFGSETNFENVEVAEELDPIFVMATSRESMMSFAMAEQTTRNLAIAFNGGDIGTPSGGTVTFEPADLGAEQRIAIFWRGDDHTEALLCKKCIQVGNIETARAKAPDKAAIPVEFRLELPSDGSSPWVKYTSDDLAYTDPH